MSRSHRSFPACGWTTSDSERWDKRFAHRRERRYVEMTLHEGKKPPATIPRMFFDPWNAAKDGKQVFDPSDHPRLMRK